MGSLETLDAVNTQIEMNAGFGAGLMEYHFRLPSSSPTFVQGLFGGPLTKVVNFLSVGLELTEVISAAKDNDPNTSPAIQAMGGLVTVVGPAVASGVVSSAVVAGLVFAGYGSAAGPAGALAGFIVGAGVNYFGEGIVEGALNGRSESQIMRDDLHNALVDNRAQDYRLAAILNNLEANGYSTVEEALRDVEYLIVNGHKIHGEIAPDSDGNWVPVTKTIMTPAGPQTVWVGATDYPETTDLTSQAARQANTSDFVSMAEAAERARALADARADAASNGHHPDNGGGLKGSELLLQQNRATGGSTTTATIPNSFVADPGKSSVVIGAGTKFVGAYTSYNGDHTATEDRRPILLDLNGNGIEIATLDRSSTFIDSNGDGLQHRTAWAGSGDGVLFYDAGMDGLITEQREYVFTEWDPTAKDDMAALRARFDTSGGPNDTPDGKLASADADFAKFKVMVTNADGSRTAKTLTELGITEINLRTDTTLITFADGSAITGQTTFTMGGVVKTAAAVTLVSEADGHKLETTVDGATTTYVAKDSAGHVVGVQTSEVQMVGRRRALTARHRRRQSVHAWTLGKLTESQGTVNFRSLNVRGIVHGPIRIGR